MMGVRGACLDPLVIALILFGNAHNCSAMSIWTHYQMLLCQRPPSTISSSRTSITANIERPPIYKSMTKSDSVPEISLRRQHSPRGDLRDSFSPTSIRSSAARHGQLEIANAHGAIRAHGLMLFDASVKGGARM